MFQFIKYFYLTGALIASIGVAAEPYFKHTRNDVDLPARCVPFQFSYFDGFGTPGDTVEDAVEYLESNHRLITVGITGAHAKGFTHEYPMERATATPIWKFLKSFLANHNKEVLATRLTAPFMTSSFEFLKLSDSATTELKLAIEDEEAYKKLAPHFARLFTPTVAGGFSFVNEGDVLEALSAEAFSRDDPNTNFNESSRLIDQWSDDFIITGGLEYHDSTGGTVGELDVVILGKSDCQVEAIGETKLGLRSLGKAKMQLSRFVGFLRNIRQ